MAALQQVVNTTGFKAKWELNELMTKTNVVSETMAIEGMPDVKWNLQWNYYPVGRKFQLYINIESKNEISYEIRFYYFKNPEQVHSTFNGTSINKNDILLHGYSNFDFHNCTTNDKLTISINGIFSYSAKESKKYNAAVEWGLRLKEGPKDFDIHVDGKIIQIQKLFLSIESPVFAKMFESNFKEAAESKVTITDANFETVEAAIDFCYRQDISDSLQDLTKSINLLYFSDKYDCQTLKPMLETHLSTKFLSKENISLLASTSDQTNSLQLRQKCIDFMCDLLKKKQGFSAEELAKLDLKFKDDVLLQAFN